MEGILKSGFRPTIITVEYNSAYGPVNSSTIEYDPKFKIGIYGEMYLYYGASISAWGKLLASFGYKFVCIDSLGESAFFLMPEGFKQEFVKAIKGLDFVEKFYQMRKYKTPWVQQFQRISHRQFKEI